MAVCGASENVEKVLRTTGFNEVAGIYPDYDTGRTRIAGKACRLFEQESMSEPQPPSCSRDFPGDSEAASEAENWVAHQTSAMGLGEEAEFAIGLCLEEIFPQRCHSMATPTARPSPYAPSPTASSSSSRTMANRSIRLSPQLNASTGRPHDFDIGGYGTGLMQKFSRRMSYRRSEGMNRLVLEFDACRNVNAGSESLSTP